MGKTLKIYSDGGISKVQLDFDSYHDIQREIGGHFETISSKRLQDYMGEGALLLVDEEGILKKLPLNPVASYLMDSTKTGIYIVGDALVAMSIGEDIVAPDEGDLEEWIERMKKEFYLQERIG